MHDDIFRMCAMPYRHGLRPPAQREFEIYLCGNIALMHTKKACDLPKRHATYQKQAMVHMSAIDYDVSHLIGAARHHSVTRTFHFSPLGASL